MSEIHHQTIRKSNKNHTCHECGERINPCQMYVVLSGTYEGQWYNVKMCTCCAAWSDAAWDHISNTLPDELQPKHGDLEQWLREHGDYEGTYRRAS